MKISCNWLKEYIDIDLPPDALADILTNTGLEVEGTQRFESVKGGLAGCFVGEVKTCERHPGADMLSVTTVDIGGDRPLDIVCGAPNVKAGQKVVVATPGTTLYRGSESLTLRKVKIRGKVSEGMICAEDEIGLGNSHEGIMVLDRKAVAGTPAAEYFRIMHDTVFELGLTPNRIDGASHFGAARDLAAWLSRERKVEAKLPSLKDFSVDNENLKIDIIIENPAACKRYAGITLTDIEVGESPAWLKNRLSSVGLNPINNVVDITNFVLYELGQPLHAFDADKVEGRAIHVKTLTEGSKFISLDNEERTLAADDLMICNVRAGMCIAGVFGGMDSGVTGNTRNVFLESAWFDPVYIRRTSRRHGLNTDASFRFERGADPEMTIPALKRAAILIREIAGGRISSGIVDVYPQKIMPRKVKVRFDRIAGLTGTQIDRAVIRRILTALDIKTDNEDDSCMHLTVPAYRVDVTREADVIEEILRIYGYNRVGFSKRMVSVISGSEKPDKDKLRQMVSNYLSNNGFNEIMCNSLSKEIHYRDNPVAVELFNPLSSDLNRLRTTLLYGGLETIKHNINHRQQNLSLYEFGNTYSLDPRRKQKDILDGYREEEHLGLFLAGNTYEGNWVEKNRPASFYDLKSYIGNILSGLGIRISNMDIRETEKEDFAEGLTYAIDGSILVDFGILEQSVTGKFELPGKVFYGDIRWDSLVKAAGNGDIKLIPIPRFPEVRRDLSMIIDKKVPFSRIQEIAQKAEKELLRSVSLFDVYESGKLGKGKKSYAVSFILQDHSKTLTDREIDKIMNRIQTGLEKEINAHIRQAES